MSRCGARSHVVAFGATKYTLRFAPDASGTVNGPVSRALHAGGGGAGATDAEATAVARGRGAGGAAAEAHADIAKRSPTRARLRLHTLIVVQRAQTVTRLRVLHRELAKCRKCPKMIGPVVHGPPVPSRVLLIGQAPGPHEGKLGRPFAWTAGKTLFRWLEETTGASESAVRECVYFAAVARCFPGKAKAGGDRRPDPEEIERCSSYLSREVALLEPDLVLAVGTLAIEQVLGEKLKLDEVVGGVRRARYHGRDVDVIALPHPSGASTWYKLEPGKSLLARALRAVRAHPAMRAALAPPR